MVPELKGGPKLARYVAQATLEHVGRKSREMGLRSVVIKVNGFTFFKKKRQMRF
ncbi:Probable ribosomal protein S11, mitochondrial [Linum grandiflorum]